MKHVVTMLYNGSMSRFEFSVWSEASDLASDLIELNKDKPGLFIGVFTNDKRVWTYETRNIQLLN